MPWSNPYIEVATENQAALDVASIARDTLSASEYAACVKAYLRESSKWRCSATEFQERSRDFVNGWCKDGSEQPSSSAPPAWKCEHGSYIPQGDIASPYCALCGLGVSITDPHIVELQRRIKRAVSRLLPSNVKSSRFLFVNGEKKRSTTQIADDLMQEAWAALLRSPTYKKLVEENNKDAQCALAWQTASGVVLKWLSKEKGGTKILPVSQLDLPSTDDYDDELLLPWDTVSSEAGEDPRVSRILHDADHDERVRLLSQFKADEPVDYGFLVRYAAAKLDNSRKNAFSNADSKRYARICKRLKQDYNLIIDEQRPADRHSLTTSDAYKLYKVQADKTVADYTVYTNNLGQ